MITGRFGNTSGRPYFAGHVSVPSLGIAGNVSFPLDTGSDATVLMPTDALRLGVLYTKLHTTTQSYGVGGISQDFREPATFAISDGDLHFYKISLVIMEARPELKDAPSLLGRDIISRWKITLDHSNGIAMADIVSSDFKAPITTPGARS